MTEATQERAKTEFFPEKTGIRLDLGCGGAKQEQFVGMDVRDIEGVDIVHDLEEFPWPIPDESCIVVLASHILEHIKPWFFFTPDASPCVMGELWRVLKPNGQVLVSAPYGVGPGYVQDPTHCNPMNEATFQYFDPRSELWKIYRTPFMFTIESVRFEQGLFLELILAKRVEAP